VLVKEFQGDLAFAIESHDEARRLYREALVGGDELAPEGDLVLEAVRRLADLESVLGFHAEAREYVARGLTISDKMEEDYERGHLFRIRARVEAAEGDIARAAESYREALRLHRKCRSPYDVAISRLEYATFCIENIVDLDTAGRHLERARETFERIGAEYEAGHAYLLAAKLEMVCDTPAGDARSHLQAAIDLLERVGDDDDREALLEVHRDIDRLLEESSLSERNDLAALNEFTARIHRAPDGRSRVAEIERALAERLDVRRAALFLADSETGALDLAPGSSLSAAAAAEALDYVHVLRGGRELGPKPLVSTSPGRDPRFARFGSEKPAALGSVAFMPLFSEDELLGGLYVDTDAEAGYFHQSDLDFLVAFGTAAGLAVQEMRLEAVRDENRQLRRKLASRSGFQGIITQSRRMLEILDLIERIRESQTTVLLQGETGTGKELFARAIHAVSSRRDRSLVTVNCAALSRDVLESELFGHVKGAFTDAKSDKIGLFEKADGGTIFLDEIDKTSPAFQERLLRVVDQGEVKPVGASQVRKIDVRIIVASNRPLLDLVEAGEFLQDLYYRLRVIALHIPPLRERKEDVPLLVEHFLDHFRRSGRSDVRGFSHEAMNLLVAHEWPGNVRDLRHEVERAVAVAPEGALLGPEDLSPELRERAVRSGPGLALGSDQTLQQYVEGIERELVVRALRKTAGNRSHAAKLLGLSRRGLLNKIARYSIDL
jgi:Nif-specific regulatory protein